MIKEIVEFKEEVFKKLQKFKGNEVMFIHIEKEDFKEAFKRQRIKKAFILKVKESFEKDPRIKSCEIIGDSSIEISIIPDEIKEVLTLKDLMVRNGLVKLKDLSKIQCGDGNWNYSPYMQGLANGLILAIATIEGKEPKYLEAPKVWLSEKER